jgi:hypothetical protein
MSLRSHDDQVAYETWSYELGHACKAAGVPEPDRPASLWYDGHTDIPTLVAEQIAKQRRAA